LLKALAETKSTTELKNRRTGLSVPVLRSKQVARSQSGSQFGSSGANHAYLRRFGEPGRDIIGAA